MKNRLTKEGFIMHARVTYQSDSSGFSKELHRRVNEYFSNTKQTRHANPAMFLKITIMLSFLFIPYGLILSNEYSELTMLVMAIMMGIALVGVAVNIVHDACHGALFSNAIANKLFGTLLILIGGYPSNWRIQHNYLHHSFTNILGLDEDIDTRGVLVFSPFGLSSKLRKYQHFYALPFYSLALLYWIFMKDFVQHKKYTQQGLYKNNKNHFIRILASKTIVLGYLLFIPLFFLDVEWWKIIVGFCVMELTAGLIATMIFQLAHVNDGPVFNQPNDNSEMSTSWIEHQLISTTNFATDNRLIFWLCGGLNHQIEHHLFPPICHIHYRALSKIVKKTAIEYSYPYNEIPKLRSAIKSHLATLKAIGTGSFDAQSSR